MYSSKMFANKSDQLTIWKHLTTIFIFTVCRLFIETISSTMKRINLKDILSLFRSLYFDSLSIVSIGNAAFTLLIMSVFVVWKPSMSLGITNRSSNLKASLNLASSQSNATVFRLSISNGTWLLLLRKKIQRNGERIWKWIWCWKIKKKWKRLSFHWHRMV